MLPSPPYNTLPILSLLSLLSFFLYYPPLKIKISLLADLPLPPPPPSLLIAVISSPRGGEIYACNL